MKHPFSILFVVSIFFIQSISAQSSYAVRASNAPGTFKPAHYNKTAGIPDPDNTKASQLIEAMADAVMKVYPQPMGVDVSPHGGIWADYRGLSESPNGPYMMNFTVQFFNIYNKKSGGVEANGESSSSLEIWVNNAKFILGVRNVLHGNDRIYRSPISGIPVEGYPKFNNMVLMTLTGKSLPWRPATKQEYLENLIASMQAELRPTSLPTLRENISKAQQLLASMSASQKNQTACLRKSKYKGTEFEYYQWEGFQSPTDTTAETLVIIDEHFYDKSLPRNSIQLLAIDRRFGTASMSAFAPTPDEKLDYKERQDRLNNIVRNPVFLHDLQDLLGQNGLNLIASGKKKSPAKKYVFAEPHIKNIDRMLDSIFRAYNPSVPSFTGSAAPADVQATTPPVFPGRNEKKLVLASRKLNSKEDVVNYIDELENKLAPVLVGAAPRRFDDPQSNNLASFGYWAAGQPKESLILALRAAKELPENDCLLNNLGATLGLCGAGYLGVPLEIVCIKKEPGNSTITNNLGQAYIEMGDPATAESWLRQTVSASPNHPHANNTLGYIYQSQGRKQDAIRCFGNSLHTSFTLDGYNGLKALSRESALKLMNYIRHRYKQPDYINFDKYKVPAQCLNTDETDRRKKEHKTYQELLDADIRKYEKLKFQQKGTAEKSLITFFNHNPRGKPYIKTFLPFATAMILSIRNAYEDKLNYLRKDLIEFEKERTKLRMEYDTSMKQMLRGFEPRIDAEGEGNADPSLPDEVCDAKKSIANFFLPLMAENNEKRFAAILQANKDFLNDYLYWIRLASVTQEIYQSEYYDVILSMLRILREVRLTTLDDFCSEKKDEQTPLTFDDEKEPECPMGKNGIEVPFVVGKFMLDCEGWGIDLGEGIKIGIEHKFGGETTLAFGLGAIIEETPKIMGHEESDFNPGAEFNAKMQFFITFDGSHIMDGGFLWESEIDVRGIGKPYELKQNFTWAVVRGFSGEGILTDAIDKAFEIKPEKQENKNVKIYKPEK